MTDERGGYNIGKIRELLTAAFTPEELRRFCMDRTIFRPAVAQFGPKYNLSDMIDELIDYCQTRLLWKEFLAGVAEANPRQYALFEAELGEMRLPRMMNRLSGQINPRYAGTGTKVVKERERDVVGSLLTFLEDRRLLTASSGYQSHFPDHLRLSAEAIRKRTNDALQQVGRDSVLTPILKRIQTAARAFQEATEGAMDGARAGGGLTPYLPMGRREFQTSLAEYRQEMAEGMIQAAAICGFELDPDFLASFEEGQQSLRW